MIRVNAFFQVNEGANEQFLAVAKELVAATQSENGCIAYDLFASQTRPDVFIICETWADAASLEAHSQAPHFTAAIAAFGDLCAAKIEKFDM